jgi:aminoglycoside phosphotransferase (APT) family kinase protein
LQHIDPADGPLPGPHNFFRGGSLDVYDAETRAAFEALRGNIDVVRARAVWEAACAPWDGPPVWIHGDLDAANLLVVGGRLSAVIDFGCCGIGDCACDLTIAWTFFEGESRRAFREALPVEPSTWVRARGWALWKAAITLARRSAPKREVERARYVLGEVLAEHDGAG